MSNESTTKPSISGLRPECLSFREVISQSIANIAPTVAPTANAAIVFASAGEGTWLTFVFATIGLVFVGMNINQFASRSASPGSLYAYIARGMGATAGVITGWSLILAYLMTAMTVMCGFVNYSEVLLGLVGISPSTGLAIFFFAMGIGIAWYVAYKDIQLSTILMLIMEGASVTLILILGIIVLAKKGTIIDPSQLTLSGTNSGGIVTGLVLAVFSYVGFESATTLGDEAKNPLRNIPRAVIISTVTSGIFFIVTSYIEVLGFQGLPISFDKSNAPLSDLANAAGVGFFGVVISVGAMISFFACTLASLNAGARILFSMGRHGIFHNFIAQFHSTNKTPHIAITISSVIIFIAPLATTANGIKILESYGYFGTIATYGFLIAYIMISIAAPIYLYREHQLRWNNVLFAVLGIGFMIIPMLGSIGIPGSNLFPIPSAPYNVFPYWFLLYLLIGAGWFIILRFRSPEIIKKMEDDIEATHTRFSDMKKV